MPSSVDKLDFLQVIYQVTKVMLFLLKWIKFDYKPPPPKEKKNMFM